MNEYYYCPFLTLSVTMIDLDGAKSFENEEGVSGCLRPFS